MNPKDIKIAVGTKEGFTSSLNLQFPNGLMLGTKQDICWMSKAEKQKIRDDFFAVAHALGVSDDQLQLIKL